MLMPTMTRVRARTMPILTVAALAMLATACHGTTKLAAEGLVGESKIGPPPPPKNAASLSRESRANAHLIARVGEKTLGPLLARRAGGASMTAWIGTADGGGRFLYTVALDATGAAKDAPRPIVALPVEVQELSLRSTGGDHPGFVASWTSLADRGLALTVAGIDDDGALRHAPIDVAHTAENIVWTEVVATPRGAVCIWAEESRAAGANLLTVALEPDGSPRGVPRRIAKGARAWQARAMGGAVGLAVVSSSGAAKPGAAGPLAWWKLDVDGHPVGEPVAITRAAPLDADAVRAPHGTFFAWTDRSGAEPEVTGAYLDDDGRLTPPAALVPFAGGSVLAGVVAGNSGAIVAWDEPHKSSRAEAPFHMARIDLAAGMKARERVALDAIGRASRELFALDDGFALLATVHACDSAEADGSTCMGLPPRPAFVRFDAALATKQVEPLRGAAPDTDAAMAWGLACEHDACSALMAESDFPTPIHAVTLAPRAGPFRVYTGAAQTIGAPQIADVSTVTSGAAFADIGVAPTPDGSLVALVTDAVDSVAATAPAARGKSAPPSSAPARGAKLEVFPLDARGRTSAPATVLSTRALSIAGVAIAGAGRGGEGAAIAWVARENGDPQVHVTRVDKLGRRMNDIQLTTAVGDASDVAIVWADGGWVVAWVDGRDGNGEVYATKVDGELRRVAREERITRAPGDASGIALLAHKDAVWLAWSDPRENVEDGFGDILLTTLSARDAKRATPEQRVLATAAHSRSPCLAPAGDGVAIGWIEESPTGVDTRGSSGYGGMIAWVDGAGRTIGSPLRVLGAAPGSPVAIAIDATTDGGVHVALARATPNAVVLDAAEAVPGSHGAPAFFPVFTLDGPPSLDVVLALSGDALFFNDDGPVDDDRRARRIALGWSSRVQRPSTSSASVNE